MVREELNLDDHYEIRVAEWNDYLIDQSAFPGNVERTESYSSLVLNMSRSIGRYN